jgi:hypothetical protein
MSKIAQKTDKLQPDEAEAVVKTDAAKAGSGPKTFPADTIVEAAEFIDTMFADLDPATETVCVSKMIVNKDDGDRPSGFWNVAEDHDAFVKWKPEKQSVPWYVSVGSVDGTMNDKGTALKRGRANVVKMHFLMLDDIGGADQSKANEPPVQPTAKVVTSEDDDGNDNMQWNYALEPTADQPRYEALLEYCFEKGWGDGGAGGSYRICRIPGSANVKEGRGGYKSVVSDWHPDRVWGLDDLAGKLGCDDLDQRVAMMASGKNKVRVTTNVTSMTPLANIDPLYDWLLANGRVVQDNGGDFADVTCPWHGDHTSGGDTAGYSPLGRGSGDWVQARGFRCLHEHCKGKLFGKAMKAWGEMGAPRVSGHDPLPWLQAKFTYVGVGKQVADLEQRVKGGTWLWELEDWGNMHKGRVLVPGRDAPIDMKTAFLESKNTRKATDTIFWPIRADQDVAVVYMNDQERINVYAPPNHTYTRSDPDVFLDHIDFLLPDDTERDLFLDWLAFKIQNPGSRSYSMIMIAEDGFGVGRSWLRALLEEMLPGMVETATLPQLIGKGTSAENTYNDWCARNLFLIIEEAKDNMSKDDFYHGYETFKKNVDTRVSKVRVNPKYGRTRDDWMFFNALIMSNHSDALAIPANDRRCCVLTNPSVMADHEYYERLQGSLGAKEPEKVYWYLMERDVSKYNNIYPPMTKGKRLMADQNLMPSDEITAHIIDNCAGQIFTKKMLRSRIMAAAHALDYSKISADPGGMLRTLWGKMGSLRDEPRGARYHVNEEQVEVRAITGKEKWRGVDAKRDRGTFLEELLKTDITGGKGLKLVK